jgi:hypothetical protein
MHFRLYDLLCIVAWYKKLKFSRETSAEPEGGARRMGKEKSE